MTEDDREALLASARSRDAFVHRAALEALGKHPQDAELGALVVASLADVSGYVQRTACEIARRWALAAAHPQLLLLLQSGEAATRYAALSALAVVGSEADVPRILSLLESDAERIVRNQAARSVRALAGPATWETVFDRFHRHDSHHCRVFACELAVAFKAANRAAELERLAGDADGHVRKAARAALGALGLA